MYQTPAQRPQWSKSQRGLAWLSFAIFFVSFVLFMVGYTGNSWYVSPVTNYHYPPDNANAPFNFGLFYLCFRGHCQYDLRQDYQIVGLLEPQLALYVAPGQVSENLGITWAYQNYRTACMAIVTIGAIFAMLALGFYLLFLSYLPCSLLAGYVAAALQILSAIISVVGVGIFGAKFYGNSNTSPFGWSFALTIVGIIFLLINGILLIPHTIMIHTYVCNKRSQASGRSRTQRTGFLGTISACFDVL